MGKSDLIFETIKSLRKLILFVRKLYITPDSTEFKSYYIIKLNCMPNLIENIKPCFIVTNSQKQLSWATLIHRKQNYVDYSSLIETQVLINHLPGNL